MAGIFFGAATLLHYCKRANKIAPDQLKNIVDGSHEAFIKYINQLAAHGGRPADLQIDGKSILFHLAKKYMYTLCAIEFEQQYVEDFGGSDDEDTYSDLPAQLDSYYQKLNCVAVFFNHADLTTELRIRDQKHKIISFTVRSIFDSVERPCPRLTT